MVDKENIKIYHMRSVFMPKMNLRYNPSGHGWQHILNNIWHFVQVESPIAVVSEMSQRLNRFHHIEWNI